MSVFGKLQAAGINVEAPDAQIEFENLIVPSGGVAKDVGIGQTFYVDSNNGANTNSGKTPSEALATIDYAVGKCTANQNDRIEVLAGHAEAITAATSLVVDIAGITINGQGHGNDRPTLTFTTAAAATISITAASVRMNNFILISNFATGITVGITVGAGGDGLILDNIEMRETANTKEWLIGISVAAGCNNVKIRGFKYFGIAGGTTSQVIKFVGASNYSEVTDFLIYVDASGAAIDALTAASLFMTFGRGVLHNLDTGAGLSISVKSDTTGFFHDLRISQLKNGVFPAGAAMAISEVYISNAIFKQGFYGVVQDS